MSTHQKRIAALQEEIAALEAENVAKKDWTLMGEATSRSRPQNSLLEEDLEYERVQKSVPVITEEVVQSLEERIKARILESQFDDVIRRRPVDDKPFLPSRFFELQDTKSKQSLAEIYEDEYTNAQTGGVAGQDRDGKLKKEHEEIEKHWEQLSGKLDALCNAHFTPKAVRVCRLSFELMRCSCLPLCTTAQGLDLYSNKRCRGVFGVGIADHHVYVLHACSRGSLCAPFRARSPGTERAHSNAETRPPQ